ncbi:hypothetical protein EYZ11_002931 [Aspergillus tanneri]|uniref:O-methyltransferase C-terminal domain-containing protein n=1 Tax=Aspergillus tanneri TaxID=1220188 RepID=A0A4S3JPK3_9EURO|nr:uncharacterized protein ATNIH1004_009523 [Aspergillus tanneri]KAA8642771.1 hypothetical protein ATNIH1004_009523 [Aspergillus tanneri]THC97576.1 hypothetical protein EYZ11_002931 [Aspergillus tanneri]
MSTQPLSPQSLDELVQLSRDLQNAVEEIVLHPEQAHTNGVADVLSAQQRIAESASKIQRLTTSPGEFINRQAIQSQHLACLRWLCHFKVVSHVPLDHSVSYEHVAAAAQVPVAQLRSIARMAMTAGFLAETQAGQLSHNSLSAAFVQNPSLVEWALFVAEGTASTASKLVEATEKFGITKEKTQTAYNLAKSTDLPFFDYLNSDARLAGQFAAYMKNITNTEATSIKHVLSAFDWQGLGKATVVDIGGSSGHVSLALAEAFPSLSLTVQDLPAAIESAPVNSPVSFQQHDFFKPQPIREADVYFLRTIIHDWPLAEATQILGHIAAAMGPKSKLLIMDIVLPPPGSASISDESLARLRDVTMLGTFNACEREQSDWEALINAIGGLRIVDVRKPARSSLSMIEVVKSVD